LLLFLPMSNFQQRMMYYAALWHGFELILADLPRLFVALRELRPTLLIAPPAFYEMVESQIENVPPVKRLAVRAALTLVRLTPTPLRPRLARRLFHQVFDALGGRMRVMITGMAPIRRSTLDLFQRLQLPLFETYGLIEAGPLTLNVPGANRLGSVGRPLAGVDIEFRSDGEIIVARRRRQAAGYFEAAAGEAERTFVGANIIATGDIGYIDNDGYLHLLGRKKEIIVSRSGEKIHPEAAEAELNACPDVERAVVLDDDGTGLVAVVRPKGAIDASIRERIERFAARVSDRRPTFTFNALIFTDLEFSRDNGFLRPNLKLDRGRIAAHFRPQIAAARSSSR
jgi:long-subunit acyl-CoA synthetase (AMP-forming)